MPGQYDVVTYMEMLEHVPDSTSVLRAIATLVRPGGRVFVSTISRNPKAYLMMILGARIPGEVNPEGTHDHKDSSPRQTVSRGEAADLLRCGIVMDARSHHALNAVKRRMSTSTIMVTFGREQG